MEDLEWRSIRQLLQVSIQLGLPPQYDKHFHIKLGGRFHSHELCVFVSGHLLDGWCHTTAQPLEKVIIRMRPQDFHTAAKHTSTIRILYSEVGDIDQGPVIDATALPTILAGTAVLRSDKTVKIAELLAGGFGGWSQASWILADGFHTNAVQ